MCIGPVDTPDIEGLVTWAIPQAIENIGKWFISLFKWEPLDIGFPIGLNWVHKDINLGAPACYDPSSTRCMLWKTYHASNRDLGFIGALATLLKLEIDLDIDYPYEVKVKEPKTYFGTWWIMDAEGKQTRANSTPALYLAITVMEAEPPRTRVLHGKAAAELGGGSRRTRAHPVVGWWVA